MEVSKSDRRHVYGSREYPRCDAPNCLYSGEYHVSGPADTERYEFLSFHFCRRHFVAWLLEEPRRIPEALCDLLDALEALRPEE